MSGNSEYLPQQWPAYFFAALDDPLLAGQWQAAGSADVRTCLAAYRNNTRGGRVRALEISYPVVQQLLGDEAFAGFANRYVAQCPALQADLDRFGADFGEFLLQQADLAEYDYIADMAKLEWCIQSVRQSALRAPLAAADLQQLDETELLQMQVKRQPSVQLYRSDYNLHQLWYWHQRPVGEPALEQGQNCIALNMCCGEQGWYLAMTAVTPEQRAVLETLQQPCLMTGLLEQINDYTDDLSAELNHWLLQGWLERHDDR